MYTVGPWSRARAMAAAARVDGGAALRAIFATALWLSVLIGAMLLARHNVRANRADRRGAARLAGVVPRDCSWRRGSSARITCRASVEEVSSFFRVARHRS